MTNTPPEWALTRAREAYARGHDQDSPELAQDIRDGKLDFCELLIDIARALVAVEAETAERVERETRSSVRHEICGEWQGYAQKIHAMPGGAVEHFVGKVLTRVDALPAKYGAKT